MSRVVDLFSRGALSLQVMSDLLKIRPFKEYVQREREMPMLEISGRIQEDQFVVSAMGSEINLATVSIGTDKWGVFALIEAHEQKLVNGFQVRVEIEPDEDLPPGAVIEVFLEGVSSQVAKELARIYGLDLNNVNLRAPNQRSFSVHFSNSGVPNGMSSSYIEEGKVPAIN